MPKKTNIREKRFVLMTEDQLQGLWSASNKGQPLQLTYDYAASAAEDSSYKEFIEIAVENFNHLDLARLVHQPIAMGMHLKACPLDAEYIKAKYKNPIIFSKFQPLNSNDSHICSTKKNNLFYDAEFNAFFMEGMVEDSIALPPFAEITCNTAHKLFQRIGIGVILHEINHLFGIKHSHMPENTNGILMVNRPKPELNDIKRGEMAKFFSIYAYGGSLPVTNYTLISPFSMQHYNIKALAPYRSFNRTRIAELLKDYPFANEIKEENYFYLLDKYAGYPTLYTYQDITALATAIYRIAPDSLSGRSFNFRKSYLIDGLYLPREDKIKLGKLIDASSHAEDFHYPILAQENTSLPIQKSSQFVINIREKLKIVTLSPNYLSCSLAVENALFLSEALVLQSDCLLIGQVDSPGIFQFSILLSGRSVSMVRSIILAVEENNKGLKNRVLLGRMQALHYLGGDHYTDLIDVCQAVALPVGKSLRCQLTNSSLVETVRLENCWFQFREETGSQNLTFIISNEEANKTCEVQFLVNKTLHLSDENSLGNLSDDALTHFNEIEAGYYSADNPAYLASLRENPLFLNQTQAKKVMQAHSSPNLATQLNYCLTIPFFHGVLDGVIDSYSAHAYVKSGLKLLPRVGLWYFDYLSPMSFALLGFVSFLEGAIKNKLSDKVNEPAEKFIHLLLFLGITELEYGFSNLWELTDQLSFWPALTAKLNQLFLQLLFAPLIKTLGYELSINLSKCCLSAAPAKEECAKTAAPFLIDNDSSLKKSVTTGPMGFFSALRVASQSVFSRKTSQLFSFFSHAEEPSPRHEMARKEAEAVSLIVQHESFAKIG